MTQSHLRRFTAVLHKDEDLWVAACPELDVVSQGGSIEEAIRNLREAIELFLECASAAEIESRMIRETWVGTVEVGGG